MREQVEKRFFRNQARHGGQFPAGFLAQFLRYLFEVGNVFCSIEGRQ
jgi:hypothetical protein